MSTTTDQMSQRASWWIAFGLASLLAGGALVFNWYRHQPATMPTESEPPDLAQQALADLEQRNFRSLSASLEQLLNDSKYTPIPTQAHPLLGQPAPDFQLQTVDEKNWSLREALQQGPVVVVFYYGYHCNHCVSQLFGLHKDIEKFRELGAQVVAISADPPELTRERYARYGAFAFPVLSDPDNRVATLYGTFTPSKKAEEDGVLMHGTFIVSRDGRIRWTNRGDSPFVENQTLLREIYRTEKGSSSPRKS